ncbi:axoneme-associated protein mst101(2)-like [Arabidopsis lyrata subsp. lyrata]|uniref:axoneme-associated protein mst101(2)-like n=1 Tax=Arabidopsis lyrata subsp. lyrata TaxID=81972 RepID=UPI000A29CC99|nr:axoneme-associated protein mst101(2)-like [Arabidopsis lyrata subsp. lyrata]XP_020871517.1 axoneme-associated protein mst101(2)-like [Arabidopsis lyrata subsp. lyrata]|eukprot:XP_020871515.1 axoneme-associated protein mst101(2)-like [Arabidopsis lyrata subsp. lyrata]
MSTKECDIYKIINILYQLDSDLEKIPLSNKVISHKEQQGEQSEEKRSWWVRVRASFERIRKAKKDASNNASDSGGSQGGSRRFVQDIEEVQKNEELEIRKLQNDIRQMIAAFKSLTQFQTEMSNHLERDLRSNKLIAILQRKNSFGSRSHVVKEIRRKVSALKCQIPSLLNKQPSRKISITESQTAEENDEISETGIDIYLPGLHVAEEFEISSAFEEVVEKFQGLDEFTQKLCLLSFAVFPENREVTRTMLMYWWIGEGFISCDDSEDSVKRILDAFSAKKLLEPVEDDRKLLPNSYKMAPHVHSAVIYLAKKMDLFELYNHNGKLIMKKSLRKKVCLVKDSSLLRDAKTSVMEPKTLQTVFNSSERFPDFTFKWFPLMDSLRVLYLGRWEQTAKRHIEVESTEFLKNMKSLKNLRLASFQGISRIERLENSICKLPELVILDLKACYNLEVLPSDIGLFEKLIYLDVSECYMLDSMPKGIAKLSKLQVLKGFVISESDHEDNCAVKHLKNLRKLSITVNKYSYKVESLMMSLTGLQKLVSLKIAWGAREEPNKAVESRETTNEEKENQGGPATEKKLKDPMERDDDQVQKKGQTSKEEKGDVEETEKQEDGVSSKKGDGINEEANLEDGTKHDEVKEERLKSDKVVEEERTTSPSEEATENIQNKSGDQKEKSNVEGDGDKGKADLEEGKKQDEVEANEVVEGEKKASPPRDSSDMIQKKPDDKSKVENKGDGDKENDDLDEGKKRDEVEAKKSESDKVVEGDEKASPPQESKDMIQNKTDDQTKLEKEGEKHDEVKAKKPESDEVVEGDEKASPPQESKHMIQNKTNDQTEVEKEGEKHDEVKAQKSESDKVVERDEKASPPQESKDMIQNRTDDQTKMEKEGEKHGEVEAGISKSENGVEGVNKASPSRESTNAIQNKPDDHQRGDKQEEKGDGEKEKVNLEEGKKHDEIKAESSKQDKVTEGDAKTSPPQESKDTMESKKDDHKENSKVQEKGDGDKEKAADLDEGKKKNEVIEESSKPDNVIEGDEKKNPPLESNDTVQSKPDDHREISKVQEIGDGEKNGDDLKKLDGGEAKSQKSDGPKSDNTTAEEIHETPSPTRKSKSRKAKLLMGMCNQTKKWGIGWQEDQSRDDTYKFPDSLKKLELECFPDTEPPRWLNPKDLKELKKLSIKGGKLSGMSDESQNAEDKWAVEILRLKYLHEFKVEWRDLKDLFPKMTLLEKYKCPKIAFCPTDGNGVWRSQPETSPNM